MQPNEPEEEIDELHRCLGFVTRMWSRLELVLRSLLQEQSGVEWPVFIRLTAGMTVDAVLDAIGSLLEMEGESARIAKFKSARARADVLKGQRNRAIHSTWVWDDGDPGRGHSAMDVLSRRSRQGIPPNSFTGGIADLEKLADDIYSNVVDFTELIRDPDFPRLDR